MAAGQPPQLLRPLAGGTTPSPSKPLFFLASVLPRPLFTPIPRSCFLYSSYHKSLPFPIFPPVSFPTSYFLLPPSLLLPLFFLPSIPPALHISSCSPSLPLPIFLFLYFLLPSFLLLPILFLASIPPLPTFPPTSTIPGSFISSCLHSSYFLYSFWRSSFPLPTYISSCLYPSCFLYFLLASIPTSSLFPPASIPPASHILLATDPLSIPIFLLPPSLLLPIFSWPPSLSLPFS